MAMRRDHGVDDGRGVSAAQVAGQEATGQAHPTWCDFDAPGSLGGVEHYSRLLLWRPTYLPEVTLLGWLRRVSYPDGSEETPAVVLQIENPEQSGEIALTAEDLASLAEHLLSLRGTLGD
jgi:hypothetical protein